MRTEHVNSAALAEVFNAAIAAHAIAAAYELGLLEELAGTDQLALDRFVLDRGLHGPTVQAITRALEIVGVVQLDEHSVRPGTELPAALENAAYFLWLTRGYRDLLVGLADLAREPADGARPVPRDTVAIASAGRDYGHRLVDPVLFPLLDRLAPRCVADLGCGSAERLIQLARSDSKFHGVGVDISDQVVTQARANVRECGVADRVEVIAADAAQLESRDEFSPVDLVMSCFMAHDLWPRESCLRSLRGIRRAFPHALHLVICDTHRSGPPGVAGTPIFTLGFELTHAAMGQYIPTAEEWLDTFVEGGWICVERHEIKIPFSTIFVLRPTG